MWESLKQKTVGWLLVLGLVMIVCGGMGSWVFSMAGVFRGTYSREPGTNKITDAGALNLVPLSLTCAALGVLVCLCAFAYGWWIVAMERTGVPKVHENVKVLARYAYNRNGDMLCEWYQIDAARDECRFYVRLMFPNRETNEFECSEPVFNSCGEGMFGQATLQNKWLGQFIGYVGSPQVPNDPGLN